ncbi:MAG: NAD(P)-binding domain-containing protein, partial [Nitrosopumilales archaeon]|nr:NAD(P)-binding domain-containing protein [Nitrosopumilales archaeon]
MKIGIVGGTGGMGKGFALRWCINHDILIGSRDATKATSAAEEYTKLASETYGKINGTVKGNDNLSIAKEAEEQAKATQMLAGATRSSFETYKKIAEEISGMGCSLLPGDIVLKRMGGDEDQQMVGGAENNVAQ